MDAPDRDEHSMKSCGVAEKSLSMARAEQVCVKTVFPGNVVFFLISLALHTAALAALWFLAVPAAGMGQGEGAGGYITVSLLPGPPGDSGSGESSASSPDAADGASASAPATADRAVEPSAAPPATDTIHAADIDPKRPDAAPAEPVPPVPAAIPVRKIKDEQKAKPKNRKAERTAVEKAVPEHARRTLDDRGQKSGRASAAGREQTGTAGGRGGQGGEKGGAGGKSSAAAAGSSAGYLKGNYEYIKKRVRQYLVYNPQAKRMGIQGMVTVAFTIQQDGRVRDVAVSKSSGHSLLDESALEAVRSAAPFAAPPEPARVIMPVQFSLR